MNPEKIKALEEELEETKNKFYQKSGRGRKGTREEVQRKQALDEEIKKREQ